MITCIRRLAHAELEAMVPGLTALLRDAVNGGASLGFMAPLSENEASAYWLSLRPEIAARTRLLLVALLDGVVVGTGQLALATQPNAWHRAQVQKLCVLAAARSCGIGTLLMAALHDEARRHGRHLLLLNTRRGGPAEQFYRRLGYLDAGGVPGYTIGPDGERYDGLTMYQELPRVTAAAS